MNEPEIKKKVRVLSLDGGGIRGLISAIVMDYVERRAAEMTNNPELRIADLFDMAVGTSTGGILVCFYLTPDSKAPFQAKYTANQALKFYEVHGWEIFNNSRYKRWLGTRMWFRAARYKSKVLEALGQDLFGDTQMNDLLKPCVIPTYDLMMQEPYFLSNMDSNEREENFYVKDVIRSTSAMPTYFSPAQVQSPETGKCMVNIDGGIFANNPALCAYTKCRKSIFPQQNYPKAQDILLFSVGTGRLNMNLPNVIKSYRWGVLDWMKTLPELMMDGSFETIVDFHMHNLFWHHDSNRRFNYKRVDVPFNSRKYSVDMADASPKNIKALKAAGKTTLKAALKQGDNQYGLDKFIELLIENSLKPLHR